MNLETYHNLTQELVVNLQSRDDVLALIALGSMAGVDHQPDEYSDHDFFVITEAGAQQVYRDATDWIPHVEQIVLHFQETAHGCKVIYQDAHVLEYAIFDLDELALAKINSYRVLFTTIDLDDALAEVRYTEKPVLNAQRTYDAMVANILIGAMRLRRGEALSGMTFIKGYALTAFVQLCWDQFAPDSLHRDTLDPMRRFEKQFPELGEEFATISQQPTLEAGRSLLALAQEEFALLQLNLRPDALTVIEVYLEQSVSG